METISPTYRLLEVNQTSETSYILNSLFETDHSIYAVSDYNVTETSSGNYTLTIILEEVCNRETAIGSGNYESLVSAFSFKLTTLPTGPDAFFNLNILFEGENQNCLNETQTSDGSVLTQADAENDSKPA